MINVAFFFLFWIKVLEVKIQGFYYVGQSIVLKVVLVIWLLFQKMFDSCVFAVGLISQFTINTVLTLFISDSESRWIGK